MLEKVPIMVQVNMCLVAFAAYLVLHNCVVRKREAARLRTSWTHAYAKH
jgi:hypothetical protein